MEGTSFASHKVLHMKKSSLLIKQTTRKDPFNYQYRIVILSNSYKSIP